MKLGLELESERFAPGDHVTGKVNVLEGGKSRALTLTLSFHEQTRDYGTVPFSADAVLHQGDLKAGDWYEFGFELPPDAQPSVKAEHSELYWELDARSDEAGLDTHANRRLVVQSSSRT